MARYRKMPVEVEAVEWTGDNLAEVQAVTGAENFGVIHPDDRGDDPEKDAEVFDRLHGVWIPLGPGMRVIKGVKGEFYPCAADVFAETYEEVR